MHDYSACELTRPPLRQRELGGAKGFSRRNLDRIQQWCSFYVGQDALYHSVGDPFPWGHHTITVDKIKAPDQALWCVRTTVENDSSRYELASTLPERLKASLPTLEEVEAERRKRPVSMVPDPYWLSVLRVVVLGLATEREKRIAAPDVEIKEVRRQAETISAKNGRLEGGLDHAESELEVARK